MKSTISYIIVFLSVVSCTRYAYDVNYIGESNYKNFYLVDTIKIVDPVRIHSQKFGGQFIISRSRLKEYNNKIDFFSRPDVFLLGYDLHYVLSPNEYHKYPYLDSSRCEYLIWQKGENGLEFSEFHGPMTFLMGLINANYFYKKYNSYESFIYSEKNNKKAYYKIVFPLCN